MVKVATIGRLGPDAPTASLIGEAEQLARTALAASPVVDLHDLKVQADDRQLLISGSVHCFYHKQLAQEAVRPFANDLIVINRVQVQP